MTNKIYLSIALGSLLKLAREEGFTENEIAQLVFSSAEGEEKEHTKAAPVLEPVDPFSVPGESHVFEETIINHTGSEPKITHIPAGPWVTKVNTEVATFSDGTTVMRQRPYLNRDFAGIRNKHDILQPDVFRIIFEEGTSLFEARQRFASPDDIQVDGDPGNPRKRMNK